MGKMEMASVASIDRGGHARSMAAWEALRRPILRNPQHRQAWIKSASSPALPVLETIVAKPERGMYGELRRRCPISEKSMAWAGVQGKIGVQHWSAADTWNLK